MLNIYSLFHINTSFSSIESGKLDELLKKCYWPLLDLIEKVDANIAIEASGLSLNSIAKKDIRWITKLKELISKEYCEFVGSGYCQIISPLIPYTINNHNLRLGNQIYKQLLNLEPVIGFVNEQAFSKSLIKIYKDNNYKGIIIDWENSFNANPDWNPDLIYKPIIVEDDNKNKIPVIWNSSYNFQKFQKYIHGDSKNFKVDKHKSNSKNKFYSLYGSDAEIFNFRPGRYENEFLNKINEWNKILKLYLNLKKKFKFIKISSILDNIKKNDKAYKQLVKIEKLVNNVK